MDKQIEVEYATLKEIGSQTGISPMTLAIKLSAARKRGIEPPLRKRIGKTFLYHKPCFMKWLWQNADETRREFVKSSEGETE